jgi:hypothetical protein
MTITKTVCCFFLFFIISCNNDPAPIVETEIENLEEVSAKPAKMVVNIDHLRLRDAPGEKGQEIGRLKKGTILYDLGEVSDFTTRVQLRGIWFDEPWLKVKTEQNLEGWVYGGAVNFDIDNPTALSKMILEKRLQTFFGKGLTLRLNRYKSDFDSLKTSNDFVGNLREGLKLRDTLTTILENRITITDNYNQIPDLFWIENAIPGYVTQLVAEGTIYYIFQDFRQLQRKALVTKGEEDDDFVALNLMVYAADSVEYFFPSWFIQTWDYGGCSLLGKDIHLKILKNIDQILNKSDLFAPEIKRIKDQLIDDITNKNVEYWENVDEIRSELDAIIAANFKVLTNEDMIALKVRRQQFEYPTENGIKLNFRSGAVN